MSRNASSIADFPEVGFEEMAVDLLQARFWPTSGWPTMVPEMRDAQPRPKPLERGMAQWSASSSRFITFYFYVLSLEYPQTLSSSI
jgi:hypothetical protein